MSQDFSEEYWFIRPSLVKCRNIKTHTRLQETRQSWDRLSQEIQDLKGLQYKKHWIAGVRCLWVTHSNVIPKKLIVMCHGGGYISGSLNTHRDMMGRFSLASDVEVLSIDYRLAPETPCPGAIEDVVAVYMALITEFDYQSDDLIMLGDSAGGGLVLSSQFDLQKRGISLPRANVLLSPWLDLTLSRDSAQAMKEKDPALNIEELSLSARYYMNDIPLDSPLGSPIYGDCIGLPPCLIQVGTDEILLDDSLDFAKKARLSGVDVELDVWDDLWHVWHAWSSMLPEAQEAIEDAGEYIWKAFQK